MGPKPSDTLSDTQAGRPQAEIGGLVCHHELRYMILWHLRGYSDPEGEFEGGEVQVDESHATIETARGTAEMLKADLLKKGWSEA